MRLVERAAEFDEVGAGLQIPPNCTRILGEYGLLDETKELCVVHDAMIMRDPPGSSASTHDGRASIALVLGNGRKAHVVEGDRIPLGDPLAHSLAQRPRLGFLRKVQAGTQHGRAPRARMTMASRIDRARILVGGTSGLSNPVIAGFAALGFALTLLYANDGVD